MNWNDPQQVLPDDSEIVWIRIGTNYGNPFLATFNESNQTFISQLSGLVIPAYMVARWSSQ